MKCLFIILKVAVERPHASPACPPWPVSLGPAPHENVERCPYVLLVGFFLAGDASSSAVRTACSVQRGIMSQHHLPPAEKRPVLPLGEKESILLSSIHLELAILFSLYHFGLPTMISSSALLRLPDQPSQPTHPCLK